MVGHLPSDPGILDKVVDLQEEVFLFPLQPLNGQALVRYPGDRRQVVIALEQESKRILAQPKQTFFYRVYVIQFFIKVFKL